MRIAFVVFNRMTALDFVGVYDPITRLKSMGFVKDMQFEIASFTESVKDDRGLRFLPTLVATPLSGFDIVVVPGGFGTREFMHDQGFVEWLASCADCPLKVSVSTGALLLAAAGFLTGKRATTHPTMFSELEKSCTVDRDARVVDDGDVVTSRGVTAAIDIGLHVVERIAGAKTKAAIKRQMDYPW